MKYTEKFWDGYITVDTKDFSTTKGALKTFMFAIIIGIFLIGIFALGVVLLNVISNLIL